MTRVPLAALAALAALAGCRSAGDGAADPSSAGGDPDEDGARARAASPPKAGEDAGAGTGAGGSGAGPAGCRAQPFAGSIPIAEASGASYVPARGDRPARLLVAGDSGTHGELNVIDAESGALVRAGELPLDDGASDDLEGLSARGGILHGLTSSGYMRAWRRAGEDLELAREAYPVAEAGSRFLCGSPHRTNCARNYEGLCLRRGEVATGDCAGFAASKADGALYCLVETGGRLRIDGSRRIDVSHGEALTGCHIAPDGSVLWAGTNLFAGRLLYAVTGWKQPASARVSVVASAGPGFPEALAAGPGGAVYIFSDTGGRPSLVEKYVCD